MKRYLFLISLLFVSHCVWAQTECELKKHPFQDDEWLHYTVSYKWGFIDLSAGEVIFEVSTEQKFGKDVYHLEGTGTTYESYDWFYKVRDKYDTWVDTVDLSPNKFSRTADEGGSYYANFYEFDRDTDTIYAKSVEEEEIKYDTLLYQDCLFDVLSLVYYCRTLDFASYALDEKIPLTLILDGEHTEIYIRYLGEEEMEVDDVGTFNTIKFSALLVEGSMFSGGEDMFIWVTDDKNRFPVRVQADILIGSVNATIDDWKGLKYPLTSKQTE